MALLTSKERKFLLEDRIYWRMQAVQYCRTIASVIGPASYKKRATLELEGRGRMSFESFKEIAYPALDVGIITCRSLMQFLGIYYRNSNGHESFDRRGRKEATDILLEDFGLPRISLDRRTGNPPGLNSRHARALLMTMGAANRGIGHLTRMPTRQLSLTNLIHGCEAALSLMNSQLYVPLGRPPIIFTSPAIAAT